MRGRQLPLALDYAPAFAFEDFFVADGNRDAVDWLRRWPAWPTTALVLHGPEACGKTHLATAFAQRSAAMLVSTATLAAEPGLEPPPAATCVVDDADRVVGEGLEQPLLHLHNALREVNGRLMLTAASPPARWPIRLRDLSSRLNAATVVGIAPPDEAQIAAVLVKLIADRRLVVDDEVVLYALPRIERSFAAARRLVAALDATALGSRRKIGVPLVREVLAALAEPADRDG